MRLTVISLRYIKSFPSCHNVGGESGQFVKVASIGLNIMTPITKHRRSVGRVVDSSVNLRKAFEESCSKRGCSRKTLAKRNFGA